MSWGVERCGKVLGEKWESVLRCGVKCGVWRSVERDAGKSVLGFPMPPPHFLLPTPHPNTLCHTSPNTSPHPHISLKKIVSRTKKKSNGPSDDPCGTPYLIFNNSDSQVFSLVYCFLLLT